MISIWGFHEVEVEFPLLLDDVEQCSFTADEIILPFTDGHCFDCIPSLQFIAISIINRKSSVITPPAIPVLKNQATKNGVPKRIAANARKK